MTLYTRIKEGEMSPWCRPATEAEILSAYGSLMARRRKSKSGGPKPKLSPTIHAHIRVMHSVGKSMAELAAAYHVSTRTIRRILEK